MAFYTGSTPDGSDMKEVQGMYVNPYNDNEWSSEPYPILTGKERRRERRKAQRKNKP